VAADLASNYRITQIYKDDPLRFSKKGRNVYSSRLFCTGAIWNCIHMFILHRFYICKSCDGNLVVVRFATLHRAREAKDNMAPHGCGLRSD